MVKNKMPHWARRKKIYLSGFLTLATVVVLFGSCSKSISIEGHESYPKLILKKQDVPQIVEGISKYPLLKASFEKAKSIADNAILNGIEIPIPKDPGGGYTHEKHKRNYIEMYNAGLVYQLTGEEKYAVFVRDMLLKYAELYPTLGLHPMKKNQAPGKLFWQGLNESVWLVYTIQAYDCIHDFLTDTERKIIEENLFKEVVKFFLTENKSTFNRIHNHGTWAVAGVGMTGLVLGDTLMVKQALYSTELDSTGGFLRQIDELFSPDGYYAEGPYYQRYALLPFVIFAKALENNIPELKIFDYKSGVLNRAVVTLLQLTNTDGRFYPINDAIKDKTWITPELVFGTNIAYFNTHDSTILDVAQKQGEVMLSIEGLEVAKAIEQGHVKTFVRKPIVIRDGKNGDAGGLAILRMGKNEKQTSVLFKFTSQGMGHGHFDRLNLNIFDRGVEIVPDYGAARFINVVAKEGGRYLNENKTWAKQTIAHNTLVINQKSNFNGSVKLADKFSPKLLFTDLSNANIQMVSAIDENCYKNDTIQRTLALIEFGDRKFLIDLFNIKGIGRVQYDLPTYFNGQIIDSNFEIQRLNQYKILGNNNGYQHLVIDAESRAFDSLARVTWAIGTGFYSLTTITNTHTNFYVVRLGANDPNYNLRNQQGFIFRGELAGSGKILSVYELHGNYNPSTEAVLGSESAIDSCKLFDDNDRVAVYVTLKNGKKIGLFIDLSFSGSNSNRVKVDNSVVTWQGNYKLTIKE
ncbi:alginate lyase family protein [Tenuifilum thalassicum]|nr:alginate lyase family protein [Tenuifilum thalassicum]